MSSMHKRERPKKVRGRFKRYFITGLLVVVPLYITVYALLFVAGIMDNAMNFLPRFLRPQSYIPFHIPGLSIIVSIIIVSIIGLFTQNFIGSWLVSFSERFMIKIPFVRVIYNSTKQFLDTFLNKGHQGFNKVVLFEFPRKGIWALGFMTGDTKGELKLRTDLTTINVFLPTTPNPTSGFYIMVPKDEAIELDMHIEDAFKVIMTGGIVVPEQFGISKAKTASARKPEKKVVKAIKRKTAVKATATKTGSGKKSRIEKVD